MTVENQGVTGTETTGGASEQPSLFTESKEASAATGDSAEGVNTGDAAAAPLPPAFEPNLKFKVLDKEHEIDPIFKAIIKDSETEKKIRELHERSYGLDPIKADRQTLRERLKEVETRAEGMESEVNTVMSYARSGDFDSFFEATGIPKVEVLRYAMELVRREQMPPEQKAQWEQQRSAVNKAREYEIQNQQLMESHQQLRVQQREFELTSTLAKPDVSAVAQAYDTGMGSPGAFREYVIRIGQAYAAQNQDIPAEQAVAEAVRHLRAVNPSLGVTPGQQQGSNAPGVVMPNQKPTIPNIQGRGTSPVKPAVKTLADLKRRAAELQAQQI